MTNYISIIICSRRKGIPKNLRENIRLTIGSIPYEVIAIDNSKNRYNIFQAYNEGVRQSVGDILCFMHDDIMFHSENWGNRVYEYFNTYSNLGCLGIAGSHMMLNTPSSFWHSAASCFHYYSRDMEGNLELISWPKEINPDVLTQLASVDGCWMCIRKSLFETIRFDDTLYDGFHCYDSDICMQIIQAGYDIGIAYGVDVEHNRRGTQDDSYFKSIRKWHEKWKDHLPVVRGASFSDEIIGNRTYFVRQIVGLEEQIATMQRVCDSKAYRLGKTLLTPFHITKKYL